MLDPECIPASATKEGSSEQKSSINANITTSKPNPSGTNKGVFIVESLGENISIFSFEVSNLNCIAHDFEQYCEHRCIYIFLEEWLDTIYDFDYD